MRVASCGHFGSYQDVLKMPFVDFLRASAWLDMEDAQRAAVERARGDNG